MKKLILIILCGLFLIACQREINIDLNNGGSTTGGTSNGGGSSGMDYIKCKINGVAKTFNYMASATKISAGGTIVVGIHGSVTSNSAEGINFSESGSNDIAIGTYSEINPALTYLAACVYTDASLTVWAAGLNSSPAHPFAFIISTASSSRLSGTFSGGLYDNNGFGTNEMIITDGEFSVPSK